VALPTGLPEAFTEPVADPLGDLVSRYARTHGPFTTTEAAAALGLGAAVVEPALAALARSGRVVSGEFRPGASGLEWCDAGVLRLVRRRSLAALRREAEPVEQAELGRFLPSWQGVGGMVRGAAGVLRVVEQLEGAALPVSALETLILPSRVVDYSSAALDELTSAGEVRWCGRGALPGGDGWVSLHLAESAPLTLPPIGDAPDGARHRAILYALAARDAQFFADLLEVLADDDPQAVDRALWDLVWAGLVTNDSLAPMRSAVAGAKSRGSSRTPTPNRYRRGRASAPRVLQRHLTGRWSLLPDRDLDPTRRALLTAELLLDRHGVLTRGAVAAENVPGGFAAMYRVLSALEESGRCRRIYAVAGLGAAQFAAPGAVDRLRAGPDRGSRTVVLAAADPANPYGAALPWPAAQGEQGHRPGRKAGALVVVVDGEAVLYVERGGRSLISFTQANAALALAADALALAVREGALGALTVERADGAGTLAGGAVAQALQRAGFTPTPRGLRLRS
jgi:ATP-dependent Lhr-like helicase